MPNGLVFTCPSSLHAQIRPLFDAHSISIDGYAAVDRSLLPVTLVCTKYQEQIRVHLNSYPQFPAVVEWTLEAPTVARRCDLLAELVTLLKEHGAREGRADEVRCTCGYLLANNTSGRCPECGSLI